MKAHSKKQIALLAFALLAGTPAFYGSPAGGAPMYPRNVLYNNLAVLPGECSEKAKKYARFGAVVGGPNFFYSSSEMERWPSRDTDWTQELAQARFESDIAAAYDLCGWHLSFEDFCRRNSSRKGFLAEDIYAKKLLLVELFSAKYRQFLSQEKRNEGFVLAETLLIDLFAEYGTVQRAEIQFRPIVELYPALAHNALSNLPCELAYFLLYRQYALEGARTVLRPIVAAEYRERFRNAPPAELLAAFLRLPRWFRAFDLEIRLTPGQRLRKPFVPGAREDLDFSEFFYFLTNGRGAKHPQVVSDTEISSWMKIFSDDWTSIKNSAEKINLQEYAERGLPDDSQLRRSIFGDMNMFGAPEISYKIPQEREKTSDSETKPATGLEASK